mmetsp:Transcript_54929/g.101662  ORF Transcript_54929/g.101662 Transcript_54929/m.101662 type:complete len:1252 (-) Transcript_54929:169-3924(-)
MAAAERTGRSAFSRLFLLFVLPILRKASKPSGLQDFDAACLPKTAVASSVRDKVTQTWKAAEGKISLNLLLWRVFTGDLALHLVCSVLTGLSSTVGRPLMLKFLIEAAAEDSSSLESHLWMLGVSCCLLVEGFGMSHAKQTLAGDFGSGFRAAMGALIQNKALALAAGVGTDADAQTLLGNDVMRMFENLKWLAQMPTSLVSLIGGAFVVLYTLGIGGVIALILQVLMLLATCYVGAKSKASEERALQSADRRLGVLRRVIEGAKAIKFNAWEDKYLEAIMAARAEECKHIQRFRMLQEAGKQLGRGVPVIAPCAAFVFLAATGADIKAGDIFAALTVFESMRMAMVMTPLAFTYIGTWMVSMRRLQKFLGLPEAKACAVHDNMALEMEAVTLAWPTMLEAPALQSIELRVALGQKVAIVGETGAGKSSLLSSLLGDLVLQDGTVRMHPSVGYVPQRAFTVSGTLKHNVVIGRDWDEEAFQMATTAACLTQDFQNLPQGVNTEIGERGVTLSGGQQARVAVARALYGKPAVLLFDDPLAAVDPVVARGMFRALVQEAPPDVTVLMALNQLQFVKDFDYVVYIANGKVVEQGRCPEVLQSASLASFLEKGGGLAAEVDEGSHVVAPPVPTGASTALTTGTSTALVTKEVQARGSMWNTLGIYVKRTGWPGAIGFSACAWGYGAYAASGLYLASWVSQTEEASASDSDTLRHAFMYAGLCMLHVGGLLIEGTGVSVGSVRAGKALHNECAQRVLGAPVTWFDSTPSGRIVSRFASDCSAVDIQLSIYSEASLSLLCTIAALVAVVCIVVPFMAPVMVAALLCYGIVVLMVDRANRDARRMANMANSPVLGLLGEVGYARGQTVIRCMKLGNYYSREFDMLMDAQNALLFTSTSLVMWGNLASYLIAAVIATVTVLLMLNTGSYDSSELGLALSYSFVLPFFLQLTGVMLSLFWMSLTALERLLECRSEAVPQEPPGHAAGDDKLTAGWPPEGCVEFHDVSMAYREGLPLSLKGVSFKVPAATSAGVVGRTGAGKSSLLIVLFRIVDATAGEVCIDGVNIAQLGLHTLRKALAIIPQDPLLVEGTIRSNIDPFNERKEAELIEAMNRVGLTAASLERSVGKGAAELSAGERQLVSLSRTLLRGVKVLVLDEPTSNIDPATDKQVHAALRAAFSSCTMLTIAHRLDTVIECDQIIVMGEGRVLECGQPQDLLSDSTSTFYEMAQSYGGGLLASAGKLKGSTSSDAADELDNKVTL